MKFLLDVCADSRLLRSALLGLGHDVLSAGERFPRALDETLLAYARDDGRVLITEDKDFGELVFFTGTAARLCCPPRGHEPESEACCHAESDRKPWERDAGRRNHRCHRESGENPIHARGRGERWRVERRLVQGLSRVSGQCARDGRSARMSSRSPWISGWHRARRRSRPGAFLLAGRSARRWPLCRRAARTGCATASTSCAGCAAHPRPTIAALGRLQPAQDEGCA